MLLERCTWQEVEDYLEGSTGILLPVGSTEQHGPNGLIGTDAICAELVARGVGEATGAMVAPPQNIGMAQHPMAFRGTMTLRPQTLLAVLVDLLNSLAQHGFERCLVINGHGGNMATVMAAFSELHAAASLNVESRTSRLRCRMRNWWGSSAVTELQRELFGDRVEPLEMIRATYNERAETPREYREMFKRTFGPIVAIYESLADHPERRDALDREFLEFAERANAGPAEGFAKYPYEYLLVVARKRGS
jgi:creatinine amidohydrolase